MLTGRVSLRDIATVVLVTITTTPSEGARAHGVCVSACVFMRICESVSECICVYKPQTRGCKN